MKAFVAPTDGDWYRFLAARPELTEANFWVPGGQRSFALKPGEPLLFKSKLADGNRLVGGGILADYRVLPVSVAWQALGQANGCEFYAEMVGKIRRYRNDGMNDLDPVIGCAMLRDTAFFAPGADLPAPADYALSNPKGKGYLLGQSPPEVEAAFARLIGIAGSRDPDLVWHRDGPMYGDPRLVAPRLGQGSFAAVVSDAYRMRCAITGAKVRPVLQAAHIRPVEKEGQHRVDNGLLLRADVHIMFDQGYLGVDPRTRELRVSRRIRDTWGNGAEFYALEGREIARTERKIDRPNAEFLQWHLDEVFQS